MSWLLGLSRRPATDYYRRRTEYYAALYELHEQLVAETGGGRSAIDAGEALRGEIRRRDSRLLDKWKHERGWHCRTPFRQLFVNLGKRTARHFSVVFVDPSDPERRDINLSVGGLFNTSGSFGARRPRAVERMATRIRPEALRPISHAEKWEWMLLKFRTERRHWPTSPFFAAPNSWGSFDDYCRRIGAFVGRWAGVSALSRISVLTELLTGASGDELESASKAFEKDPALRAVVNFFYLHGN